MNNPIEIEKAFLRKECLDQVRLQNYVYYLKEYYYDEFHPGQGTEAVLRTLRAHYRAGLWLDIGAGPTTLFWSLMLSDIKELHCSEVCVEGIKVLDDFMNSRKVPRCYKSVMKLFKINSKIIRINKSIPRKYFVFDAMNKWPLSLGEQVYDLITAFGVFGLCTTPEKYKNCFGHIRTALKGDGVTIGANWVRSRSYIDTNGVDNRYLTPKLVKEAAAQNGFQIVHLSEERINGDPKYDRVIIWALKPC